MQNASIGYTHSDSSGGSSDSQDTAVLSEVSLKLTRGSRIAFLGPNGAGKTTLMRTLAARLPLVAGSKENAEVSRGLV